MSGLAIDGKTDILGLIDVQPTFMPGGELPVAGGASVVEPINRLLAGPFATAFATQDWHPRGHISFASSHGLPAFAEIAAPYGPQTLWPDHAVQGSANAALHPSIVQDRIAVIVRKGMQAAVDSYSAFFENDRTTPTGLDGWLRNRGVRRLFLCGLATDFCVAWSAEDAATLGYAVFVVDDACRGIALPTADGSDSITRARERLAVRGVRFTTTAALTS
ncbi:MAG: bifunctional nicotinamidase/pyrazinamidase [Alphaproteobacteria bacterium]|nr:bifunctional nicotinamidase/pyrazinamidase [Alphaproteobacteria bacterium]